MPALTQRKLRHLPHYRLRTIVLLFSGAWGRWMRMITRVLAAGTAIVSVLTISAAASAAAPASRCEAVDGGVEYRSYLPDQKRYVYVSVKALGGYYPSIFVTIDKNYDAPPGKIADNDPLNAWWIDRSKPMAFSSDKVTIRWPEHSTWTSMTSWISSPDTKEMAQGIRGLSPSDGRFVGTGTADINSFAFQSRVEVTDNAPSLDVIVPTVSYEGVTVSPPPVHFERDGRDLSVHC